MENFNLDSDSYKEHEIEDLLHLKHPYSMEDILNSKTTLLDQLVTNEGGLLQVEKRRELMFFIDTISQRLANKINNGGERPTVIQQGSNFIIENPDRNPGKNAQVANGRITVGSTSNPPGYMNPINVRTITQAISIDSRFRPNYSKSKSTDFQVVLPSMQKNVIAMRVASIELPTSYYAVAQAYNNNVFVIVNNTVNVGDITYDCWIVTLPDGNYEQAWANNSQAAVIDTAMTAAIALAQPATVDADGTITPIEVGGTYLSPGDITFALMQINGKAIFQIPAGSSIFSADGFSLRFDVNSSGNLNDTQSLQLRLGWQLGFRKAKYSSTSSNTAIMSEGICLICGPRYGFISIDDYQKNTGPSYIVAYANSVLQDNIITRINLAELQADVGVYQSSSDPGLSNQLNRTREYFGPVDIQRLHIILYDEFGRVIDLNYMDWSLTLAFEILYN